MDNKILVVDDDQNIVELLKMYLQSDGYTVYTAFDGEEAVKVFEEKQPEFILLDIMLPKMDGWQVTREIRKTSDVPIMMLTAKGETFDKVLGLELGADDYVVKPFETKEVLARVKAILRRTSTTGESDSSDGEQKILKFDNLEINMINYEMKVNDEVVDTPPKELELIYFLASNPNQAFSRDQLIEKVWDFDYRGESRTVDVHIKRLREKLDGASENWNLKTIWGRGYKFETK